MVEVLVPRDGSLLDLQVGLQKKLNLEEDAIKDLRVFEAHSGKFYREHQQDSKISGINDFVPLYAEKIPEEELNLEQRERVISAFNFDREPNRPHGVPFKFVMKPVSALVLLLNLSVRILIISNRVRSSGRRRRGSPSEPASKARTSRRSSLPLSLGLCTLPVRGILRMVSYFSCCAIVHDLY